MKYKYAGDDHYLKEDRGLIANWSPIKQEWLTFVKYFLYFVCGELQGASFEYIPIRFELSPSPPPCPNCCLEVWLESWMWNTLDINAVRQKAKYYSCNLKLSQKGVSDPFSSRLIREG